MADEVLERNYDVNNENAIEFIRGRKTMTVTFSQKKWISKVKKMAEKDPDKVQIISECNGNIVAHMPVKALHLYLNKGREYSPEQKEKMANAMRERMKLRYGDKFDETKFKENFDEDFDEYDDEDFDEYDDEDFDE